MAAFNPASTYSFSSSHPTCWLKSRISEPTEKAFSTPVSTTQRTEGSSSNCLKLACRARLTPNLSTPNGSEAIFIKATPSSVRLTCIAEASRNCLSVSSRECSFIEKVPFFSQALGDIDAWFFHDFVPQSHRIRSEQV